MRYVIRSIVEGLSTVAMGILAIGLHSTLLSIAKANARQAAALQNYRPVYTRSGRRNRVRC